MGKQIYFVHTEENAVQLFLYIEKAGGQIMENHCLHKPSDMLARMESNMCRSNLSQYPVVFAPDNSYEKLVKHARIADGSAVEVSNSWKWSDNLHTYYDKGRIYLAQTPVGGYDENALRIYKKLCIYLKKEYIFVKQMGLYLSPEFKGKYETGQLRISQLGIPVNFLLDER